MLLLGMQWTNVRIANAIGITVPTLIKNYFTGLGRKDRLGKMLALRECAKARLEANYRHRVFTKAMEGDVSALRLMGQILERELGLQALVEAPEDEEEPLGKKDRANLAAKDVPEGWAAVLGEPTKPN